MTDKIARVCDYCGKADTLETHSDSNGMVIVQGQDCYLLLMRDIRKRESSRPSFALTDKAYCPECLVEAITDWLQRSK